MLGSVPDGGWVFHLIEQRNGSWRVYSSHTLQSQHTTMDDATTRAVAIAEDYRPSTVYAHDLDGRVFTLATFAE